MTWVNIYKLIASFPGPFLLRWNLKWTLKLPIKLKVTLLISNLTVISVITYDEMWYQNEWIIADRRCTIWFSQDVFFPLPSVSTSNGHNSNKCQLFEKDITMSMKWPLKYKMTRFEALWAQLVHYHILKCWKWILNKGRQNRATVGTLSM